MIRETKRASLLRKPAFGAGESPRPYARYTGICLANLARTPLALRADDEHFVLKTGNTPTLVNVPMNFLGLHFLLSQARRPGNIMGASPPPAQVSDKA